MIEQHLFATEPQFLAHRFALGLEVLQAYTRSPYAEFTLDGRQGVDDEGVVVRRRDAQRIAEEVADRDAAWQPFGFAPERFVDAPADRGGWGATLVWLRSK